MTEFTPEGMATLDRALGMVRSQRNSEPRDALNWLQNKCFSGSLKAVVLVESGYTYDIPGNLFADVKKVEEMTRSGRCSVPGAWGGDPHRGRVLFNEKEICALLSRETEPDQSKTYEVNQTNQSKYIPPYIAFMLQGVEALSMRPDQKVSKDEIERWIEEHWPKSLGTLTKNLASNMATLMRRPADAKGGNTPWAPRQ